MSAPTSHQPSSPAPAGAGHLVANPAAAPIRPPTDPGWAHASAQLSDATSALCSRDDLLVSIAPGAGRGAPGCFLPNAARIELDGTLLGVDPGSLDTADPSDPHRYPAAYGVLIHECAHAVHTRWQAPTPTSPVLVAAARLLDEPRIEARHLRRHPDHQPWLRASATTVSLAGLPTSPPTVTGPTTPTGPTAPTGPVAPTGRVTLTRWQAAELACLALGRADGSVLNPADIADISQLVTDALGRRLLTQLRRIWRAALRTTDQRGDRMLGHATRWCAALGAPPAATTPTGDATRPTSLTADRARDALTGLEAAIRAEHTRHADRAATQRRRHAADRVFGTPPTPSHRRTLAGTSPLAGTRPPTSEETAAARRLAAALDAAGIRETSRVRTPAATPPGRLHMAGVLSAEAQRAAGTRPTAMPFTRHHRRRTPVPPLRAGIACDISGSMAGCAAQVASAAWILARAAAWTTAADVVTATVAFGHTVTALTHPGAAPRLVTEFRATDTSHQPEAALDALTAALELTSPGTARLAVVISDGHYPNPQRAATRTRLEVLAATGCALLWLTPATDAPPAGPATVEPLATGDPLIPRLSAALTAALAATT